MAVDAKELEIMYPPETAQVPKTGPPTAEEGRRYIPYSPWDWEIWLFLIIMTGGLTLLGSYMGINNMFSSIMKTAHDLLLNTALFITSITILMGAFSNLLGEYGVLALANQALAPITRILYGMPGVSAMAAMTCFLSDNPAVLSLAYNRSFRRYFQKYQVPALTNLGTAYGMGLIVVTFMIAQGFVLAPLVGFAGAIIGSVVSVRIMERKTKKFFGDHALEPDTEVNGDNLEDLLKYREVRTGGGGRRFLEALLDGGKQGLQVGITSLPGIVIICTFILMLTFGPQNAATGYQGLAYEGVPVLPRLGQYLDVVLKPLFGFSSVQAIAFPLTALGAVGAALGLVPKLIGSGLIGANDIAVFTAMGMCWSGYLSTHIAMMDSLGYRSLAPKSIAAQTIGGLVAGICAHWLYVGIMAVH